MRFLKQSTAFTFRIGPFLDDTDGKTAETGLTISQADIQISKAGGAFAQTSAAPTTTHDVDGWYQCPLTATDTETLGSLTVQIIVAGALPVWEHFMVLPSNVYDSLIGGSDYLQTDTVQVEGSDATDQINAACDTAISDAALATAAALATVDGIVDSILEDTGTTLDTLIKAIPTNDEFALRTLPAADYTVVSDLGTVQTADHTASIAAIGAKTVNLPTDPADQSAVEAAISAITAITAPTASEVAAAVLDEVLPDLADNSLNAGESMTPRKILRALFNRFFRKVTQTSSAQIVMNDSNTQIASMTVSDDGTTQTKDIAT